jgi:hypothetical protein
LKFFKFFIFDFRPWGMDLGAWDMRLATLNLGTWVVALALAVAVGFIHHHHHRGGGGGG